MAYLQATNTSAAVPVGANVIADPAANNNPNSTSPVGGSGNTGVNTVTWVENETVTVAELGTLGVSAGTSQAITVQTGNQSGGGAGNSGDFTVAGNTGIDTFVYTGFSAGTTPLPSGDIILATGSAVAAGGEGSVLIEGSAGTPSGPVLSMGHSIVAPESEGPPGGNVELAFATSAMTIPINFLKAGSSIRFHAFVTASVVNAGGITHIIRVRYGDVGTPAAAGNAILAETEDVLLNQANGDVGIIEGTMTVRSTAVPAATTISTVARTIMGTPEANQNVEVYAAPPQVAAPTIDITSAQSVFVTVEFSGADGTSEIRLDQFVVVVAA